MKIAIVFATLVAATMAGRISDPIFEEYVPLPEGLVHHPEVHSQVLDFPNSEHPIVRFHINMKGSVEQEVIRRAARSILGGVLLPKWILNPEEANPLPERLPETRDLPGGAQPQIPIPERPTPELLPEIRPSPEVLPEVLPERELPTPILPAPRPEGGIQEHVFRWPDAQNQLVKLRIKVNEQPASDLKIRLPEQGHFDDSNVLFDPIIGFQPKPMPIPKAAVVPQIEVFIDIGEQAKYW